MRCAILTIGTELLFGSVIDTNKAFLSSELQNLGIDVMYHMTSGDNPKRLSELLEFSFKDTDLVITTGGLGPTQDDLTKEIAAKYFGEKLIEVKEEREKLENWFKKSGKHFTENNLRQAFFPEHFCEIFPNPMGTASGFMINKNGKIFAALPGPPVEMKPMFSNCLKPFLESRRTSAIRYKTIRTYDIGESELETRLMSLIDGQSDPTLATYATPFESSLRIASKRASKEEAEDAINEMTKKVRAIVGDHIYSEDGSTMDKVVLDILLKKKISLSSAESMTGGKFSKTVTDRPGVSEIFDRGLVTYSNNAKIEELGVSKESLDKYTAVSKEVALEMADGLFKASKSDICISVTGIAGPGGGSEKTPVGTFFVGLRFKGKTRVFEHRVTRKSRENIRDGAVQYMFRDIYKILKAEGIVFN